MLNIEPCRKNQPNARSWPQVGEGRPLSEFLTTTDVPPGRDGASFQIRPARPDDCETIANLVRELAIYEKLEHRAVATADDFRRNLFGPRPYAETLLAESSGRPIGLVLFFHTFSTFRGQPGIYIEDIFVRTEERRRGVGKALLASVARIAEERGCGRVEWSVLNWNTPSIALYASLGARPMSEWTVYRLDEEPLRQLASLAPALDLDDPGETRLG